MSIQSWAIVQGTTVVNICLWDGETEWSAPTGCVCVALEEGEYCDIGQSYDPNATPRFYRND